MRRARRTISQQPSTADFRSPSNRPTPAGSGSPSAFRCREASSAWSSSRTRSHPWTRRRHEVRFPPTTNVLMPCTTWGAPRCSSTVLQRATLTPCALPWRIVCTSSIVRVCFRLSRCFMLRSRRVRTAPSSHRKVRRSSRSAVVPPELTAALDPIQCLNFLPRRCPRHCSRQRPILTLRETFTWRRPQISVSSARALTSMARLSGGPSGNSCRRTSDRTAWLVCKMLSHIVRTGGADMALVPGARPTPEA
mmetsp:Transcript_11671/g.29908  ORF Transcript_11671/g.29908 Transcript_11671/m.29908 type:complete len:250 (+) Transcript_11671:582-1331(+)